MGVTDILLKSSCCGDVGFKRPLIPFCGSTGFISVN